jgi:hypothetical protein
MPERFACFLIGIGNTGEQFISFFATLIASEL